MTVTEARAALPDLIERVGAGDEVTITRHGQPVAVVVRPDRLRHRRAEAALARAARLHEELDTARQVPLAATGTLSPEEADELVAEIRAGRDSRGPNW